LCTAPSSSAEMPVFRTKLLQDCTKLWEGTPVVDSFTYEFAPGERIGIAGPNGAGKSTLLDMISGDLQLDVGQREPGETTVIGYFRQHPPPLNPKLKIIDYITGEAEKRCASD
jgi:ABC transport system ATP-binding/permease protein